MCRTSTCRLLKLHKCAQLTNTCKDDVYSFIFFFYFSMCDYANLDMQVKYKRITDKCIFFNTFFRGAVWTTYSTVM